MVNNIPMWWMRGRNTALPQESAAAPEAPHNPLRIPAELSDLTARLRSLDTETLLLLALLWLLYQEHADRKLLLALAYIAI